MGGPLKKYRVARGGVETVMKLSDADASRLGVKAEDAVDGASTIEPVEPVTGDEPDDETGGSDGTGDGDGAEVAVPDISEDTGAQQVQPAADAGGDGQTPPAPAPAPAADGAGAKSAAKKAPAKRQPTAANKARTAAATKAADGGS